MKKLFGLVLILLIIAAGIIFALNYFQLEKPMTDVLKNNSSNKGIKISVYYDNYINLSKIVISIKGISGQNSRADVFRVFLQFAEKMKDKKFTYVYFAFNRDKRFMIDGDYFQKLGKEYSFQNPAYTIRTFPENLKNPKGTSAYSSWTGGLIGVLNKQMEDFNDFHDKWYINDLLIK